LVVRETLLIMQPRSSLKRIIAYIPARGGSKRITRKNVRVLGGRPVLLHVIDSIRAASVAETICVSTDDERIRRVAESSGALVLDPRSKKLSDDRATFMDLLRQDVPRYLKHLRVAENDASILFTLATAALVPPETYRDARKVFLRTRAPILAATRPCSPSPFRALVKKGMGWRPLFPAKLLERSQDLPDAQADAGLFYYLDFETMTGHRGHWFTRKGLVCLGVPGEVSVDVDTLTDWEELERKYRERAR
jgi:pseudaminic acid cytidylyltransferase